MQLPSPSTAIARSNGALSASVLSQNRLIANGSNWIAFKLRMRGVLSSCWYVIEPTAAPAGSAKLKEKKSAAAASAAAADPAADDTAADDSAFACATLAQVLPDEMLLMVQKEMIEQNAAAVWSKLTAHFERKTTASRAHTRAQLHHIRMLHGEKFDLYKARAMALSMQLQGMGEIVTESELVFVLLQGLPNSYKGVREALEMQDALTVEGVSDKLRDVMERRAFGEEAEEEERTMFAGSSGRGGRGGSRGGYGRGGRGGFSSGNSRTAAGDYNRGANTHKNDDEPMDEQQHRCALCRARGHWERFCPHRRGNGNTCYRCGASDHQMRDCKTDLTTLKKTEDGSAKAAAFRALDDEDEYDDGHVGF